MPYDRCFSLTSEDIYTEKSETYSATLSKNQNMKLRIYQN